MKMIFISDIHIDEQPPKNRIDSYLDTVLYKLESVFKYALDHKIKVITVAGDFFNRPNISWYTFNRVVDLLQKYSTIKLYIVLGQHDLYFRSLDRDRSAIGSLERSKLIYILSNKGTIFGDVALYGLNFGEKLNIDVNKKHINILVAHYPVGLKKKFPYIKGLTNPQRVAKKFSAFNVIHTGDFHYTTIRQYDQQWVINPGSLVRKKIATEDLNHKPSFVIYNTKTNQVIKKIISCAPVEVVFDLSDKESNKIKEERKEVQELISKLIGLASSPESKINFRKKLIKRCNHLKANLRNDVLYIFDTIYQEIHNGK